MDEPFLKALLFGGVYSGLIFVVHCWVYSKKNLKYNEHSGSYALISILYFGSYTSVLLLYYGNFIILDVEFAKLLVFIGTICMAVFIPIIILKMQEVEGNVAQFKLESFIKKNINDSTNKVEGILEEQNKQIVDTEKTFGVISKAVLENSQVLTELKTQLAKQNANIATLVTSNQKNMESVRFTKKRNENSIKKNRKRRTNN